MAVSRKSVNKTSNQDFQRADAWLKTSIVLKDKDGNVLRDENGQIRTVYLNRDMPLYVDRQPWMKALIDQASADPEKSFTGHITVHVVDNNPADAEDFTF